MSRTRGLVFCIVALLLFSVSALLLVLSDFDSAFLQGCGGGTCEPLPTQSHGCDKSQGNPHCVTAEPPEEPTTVPEEPTEIPEEPTDQPADTPIPVENTKTPVPAEVVNTPEPDEVENTPAPVETPVPNRVLPTPIVFPTTALQSAQSTVASCAYAVECEQECCPLDQSEVELNESKTGFLDMLTEALPNWLDGWSVHVSPDD